MLVPPCRIVLCDLWFLSRRATVATVGLGALAHSGVAMVKAMLALAAQRALAASLIDDGTALLDGVDGPAPPSAEMWVAESPGDGGAEAVARDR